MLTRLKVTGFKNLVDVDVSFGPFTCIAGANGVGKSNLLDAILFLSALADRPLLDAGLSVRDQGGKTGDIRGLFHHFGDQFAEEMSFEAEMIIPRTGWDDLGQVAKATATFVSYSIGLRYRQGDDKARSLGSLELIREDLKHITLGEASRHLPFKPSQQWRKRFITNERRTPNYISTEGTGPDRTINVHQDGGSSGKPQRLLAANLPRTVLSAANSAESPTATLTKREMQSWRLLQLEPSALRAPDNFTAPVEMASDGEHLPATLYHLAHQFNHATVDGGASKANGNGAAGIYAEVANRLSQLIDDVRSIDVDRDESRQLLTILARGRDGTAYPARALSDGTLRFLALTVLSIDPNASGVICMEEPENGIHPERIPAIIELLKDLTTDIESEEPESQWGPLRQVIINTHSPAVVMQVPPESLLIGEAVEMNRGGTSFKALRLRCLDDTWRVGTMESVSLGRMLAYLNPVAVTPVIDGVVNGPKGKGKGALRVVDRDDIKQYRIPFHELSE